MTFIADPDPLQQDIDHLTATIQSPSSSDSDRFVASRRLKTIMEHSDVIRRVEQIASSLQLSGIFAHLSDEDLARLVSPSGLSRLVTRLIARTRVECGDTASNLLEGGRHSEPGLSFDDLHSAVRYELFEEFTRRRDEKETPDGRLVRALLVEEDERGTRLPTLARRIAARLSVPGPGDWKDGEAEARSEAAAKLWEMIGPYVDNAPTASRDLLLKYLRGQFNATLGIVRDGVRSKIETECRRRDLVEYNSEKVELWVEPAGVADSNPETVTRKILLEQVFAKAKLSDEERNLVIEHYVNARGQHDIARELGVSQTVVSRRVKTVLDKLSRVAVDRFPKTFF